MNEAFQTYADNLRRLGNLFNENQSALHRAFELVDGHQAVLRRIANDFMWNNVRPTPLHPDDVKALEEGTFLDTQVFLRSEGQTIDYEWYFDQYNLVRCVIMMAEGIRKFLGLDNEPKKEQPVDAPPENETVFGGDYGEQNQAQG